MPRGGRPHGRVCVDCNKLYKGKANSPCPNCGSKATEHLLGRTAADFETPEVVPIAPVIPTAPVAPPAPTFRPAPPGGGGITPEMLLAARSKLKKIPLKPLPGGNLSAIPKGIRVIANEIKGTTLFNVRYARPCPGANGIFYLPPVPLDLRGALNCIASGIVNLAHNNFNTQYRNAGGEMPWRSNPFETAGILYYEYGWAQVVAPTLYRSWKNPNGTPAPKFVQDRLSGFLQQDNGKLNTTRLIIAESGETFFTPDHYRTFFRYAPALLQWTPYLSPIARYDWDEWDASIYQA